MVGFSAMGPGSISDVDGRCAPGVVIAGFLRELLLFHDEVAPAPDMISSSLTRFVVDRW